MRFYIATALAPLLVASVYAEPDARRYERTYDCGFVEIKARGAECANDLDCPSLSNVTFERLSYRIGGKTYQLPALPKQFPLGPRILHESDRIYRVSQLDCREERTFTILYWGGGNCSSGCELMAAYAIIDKKVVPQRIVRDVRNLKPVVKRFTSQDGSENTKWIDPRP